MEDKLKEVVQEIKVLSESKAKQEDTNITMEIVLAVVEEYLENLENLILGSSNPLKRAVYFGILFAQTPTYDDLISRNIHLAPYFELIKDAECLTPRNVNVFEQIRTYFKGSGG